MERTKKARRNWKKQDRPGSRTNGVKTRGNELYIGHLDSKWLVLVAKDDMNFAKQGEVSTEGFCFVTITRMAVVQGYVGKKNGAISCRASN